MDEEINVEVLITSLIKPYPFNDIFESIDTKNPSKDIIDESVIMTNGWQMYGSQKPSNAPYKLTKIFMYTDLEELIEIKNE